MHKTFRLNLKQSMAIGRWLESHEEDVKTHNTRQITKMIAAALELPKLNAGHVKRSADCIGIKLIVTRKGNKRNSNIQDKLVFLAKVIRNNSEALTEKETTGLNVIISRTAFDVNLCKEI